MKINEYLWAQFLKFSNEQFSSCRGPLGTFYSGTTLELFDLNVLVFILEYESRLWSLKYILPKLSETWGKSENFSQIRFTSPIALCWPHLMVGSWAPGYLVLCRPHLIGGDDPNNGSTWAPADSLQ